MSDVQQEAEKALTKDWERIARDCLKRDMEWAKGANALRALLASRDQRIKRLRAVVQAGVPAAGNSGAPLLIALNALQPGDLDPVGQQEEAE